MKKLLSYFSISLILIVFACKKEDDCGGLECQNGGTCVNNICDCPPHYTGSDCGQQITPTKISIIKVQLSKWSIKKPSGDDWDESPCFGPLPDIYMTIENSKGLLVETSFVSECQEDSIYTYTDNFPLETSTVSTDLILSLYDKDTGFCFPSDSMGTVQAPLYFSSNDFPSTLELNSKEPPVTVKVFIEYTF